MNIADDLAAALRPRNYCPHTPTPKQSTFLALDCLEALYGGAAGGGKSDALLMAALEYVHVPGYAALILRRKYTDLAKPNAIMDRALDWLRAKVPWNERDKRFTFPSGATLSFGYCDSQNDLRNYQGAEVQFLGIDELTQWPERWYRYLLSRLRRPKSLSRVPLRARAGTNPGDIGHAWVHRRFIDEATREDRAFVPSTLDDNPHLDVEEYRRSLAQLDTATRKQLEEGLWVRDPGGLVYSDFSEANLVEEAPMLQHFILAMDFGVTNATSFVVLGWRDNDPCVYVVHSEKHEGMSPSDAAERYSELEKTWRFVRVVGDVGGLGKAFATEMRQRHTIPVEPADKQNKRGFVSLFNGDLARRRIKLVRASTMGLQAEWLELPWDETRIKEAAGFNNHEADGALYGWRACRAYHEAPLTEAPKPGTREAADAEAVRIEDQHHHRLDRQRRESSLESEGFHSEFGEDWL
jgi:hypothetical protein